MICLIFCFSVFLHSKHRHKVQIFWEGHKNMKKISFLVLMLLINKYILSKQWGEIFPILWPSHNIWTLPSLIFNASEKLDSFEFKIKFLMQSLHCSQSSTRDVLHLVLPRHQTEKHDQIKNHFIPSRSSASPADSHPPSFRKDFFVWFAVQG